MYWLFGYFLYLADAFKMCLDKADALVLGWTRTDVRCHYDNVNVRARYTFSVFLLFSRDSISRGFFPESHIHTNHGNRAPSHFIDTTIPVKCFVQRTFSLTSELFYFFFSTIEDIRNSAIFLKSKPDFKRGSPHSTLILLLLLLLLLLLINWVN